MLCYPHSPFQITGCRWRKLGRQAGHKLVNSSGCKARPGAPCHAVRAMSWSCVCACEALDGQSGPARLLSSATGSREEERRRGAVSEWELRKQC